ncbi:endonuclease/exonuclease/phosphatase family protein [Bombardia bombarda]|uniref:Endonuclease/exonuclease/phosphatase family protein n=1 Tax=Bombardia bombarda TaxID=252184 RepID=A0AA39X0G4_9PEZI|nr:endonuclease/exonuclease/phosphatase family protein [Bombardia bombarda]
MEAIIAQAIKDTAASRKTSVPWNLDEPFPQSYYDFDGSASSWVSKKPSANTAATPNNGDDTEITNIALYTWNIDFMLPFPEARMRPALAHLDELIRRLPPTTAPVIFLQECTSSDLTTIAATPWVRERFHLSDINTANWATAHYGTTTLVDVRLPVTAAFRVHYSKTRMDRDALFVDVTLGSGGATVRLCNTHLESLALEPPFRPAQMQLVARYMRGGDGKVVDVALAAGDFNSIQPFDRTLHEDNGLKDAFLEVGGREDSEEGYTWGQQAATRLREQFGCSRMDKVYFWEGEGARVRVRVVRFERFGGDVVVEGEEEGRRIVELGFEKGWVTDHLGVMVVVEVENLKGKGVERL